MRDIRDPRILFLKGGLFVLLGGLAYAAILIVNPSLQVAVLTAICVWAFCRAYYFAFYVVEHYVDADYRFAGLVSFARYVLNRRHHHRQQLSRESPPPSSGGGSR